MDEAWDSFSRAKVEAQDGPYRDERRYVCRECGKSVVWRRGGGGRTPCFAHYPGEASEETCSLYADGGGSGGSCLHEAFDVGRRDLEYDVFLRRVWGPSGLTWVLEVKIPRFDGFERFSIELAGVPNFRVHSRELRLSGARASVPLGLAMTRPVLARAETGPSEKYRQLVADPLALLPATRESLFDLSARGRRVSRTGPLLEGHEYVVVTHDQGLAEEVLKLFRGRELQPQEPWRAIEFWLPIGSRVEHLRGAVSQLFERTIEGSPGVVSLIWPPAVRSAPDGDPIVAPGSKVVFEASMPSSSSASELLFREEGERAAQGVRCEGGRKRTIVVEALSTGVYYAWVRSLPHGLNLPHAIAARVFVQPSAAVSGRDWSSDPIRGEV